MLQVWGGFFALKIYQQIVCRLFISTISVNHSVSFKKIIIL